MPDLQKLNNAKERILSTIRMKGPSLPVHIAKALDTSPLFASAFLSELYSDKEILISNMKVGNSPLYYIKGQEPSLERFTQHLNTREKEAFFLLKEKKILNDEKQTPIIRVALRAIKDFAIPIKVKLNDQPQLFWKHFQLSDEELRNMFQSIMGIPKKEPEKEEIKAEQTPSKTLMEPKEPPKPKPVEKPIEEKSEEVEEEDEIEEIPKEPKKKTRPVDLTFTNTIKDHLSSKNISLIESLSEKKKEFMAKVKINTPLGEQELLLIAKDKKRVNETDINLALQRSQSEKMPAIIISPGELDKKAIPHLEKWKNLIKFEKL